MTEGVTAHVYRIGEAIAPYVHDAAVVSLILLLAAFWVIVVVVDLAGLTVQRPHLTCRGWIELFLLWHLLG